MGWFFSGSEPKGGYSVISEKVVPDGDGEVIEDVCTLIAADKLTGQAQHCWHPDVISHVKSNQGVTDMSLIEKHAAVVGHNQSNVTVYEDGSLDISSERGDYELSACDRLIVTYETGRGRGHSVCIQASQFSEYAEQYEIRHIFTRR